MSDSTTRYVPRDYRRVCDVCGNLRNISQMHKQDELWVCTYDYGERVRTELDRGNARQRPFTIKPVPHAKPWDNYYPNSLETDEAATFNFLAQQVEAQCRYELVDSGAAPLTSAGGALPALSWAARYYYDLIIADDRELLVSKARELLNTIATYLLTRQRGSGIASAGRADDPWFGGFLASGASTYVTQDTSTSGLAMLYAYRIFGTLSYLASARAAANYLRNVQAIGRYATTYFTSSNSAGTARLYTGAVCSEVSTAIGIDPGDIFFSNNLFYPSDLIALEFWNELKLTDGDQTIGATGTASDAFTGAPSQLLSLSITDMRTCWSTGITDATGTLINGLSTTTPKEFFNAYPATKPEFTSITGTGAWEYADGASGTLISSQNWAMAVSSLYNYEGATATVTGISDWLRTFTSNADFETPDDTSTPELYKTTTGEYDPTTTIATLLDTATLENGSSLYDWGAFGLLARLWASRNTASFRQSRLYPLNTVQRFYNGNTTDTATDRIILRGLSGLSMQTGFEIVLGYGTAFPIGNPLPGASRDAQGSNVEWDTGEVAIAAPGTHDSYDVTTIDDVGGADAMTFDDAGSICPDGGVVYIHNLLGDVIQANHMSTAPSATAYPFFCIGETDLTIANGETVGFVRSDELQAWVQVGAGVVVNDAVLAAQYGRAFRESRS